MPNFVGSFLSAHMWVYRCCTIWYSFCTPTSSDPTSDTKFCGGLRYLTLEGTYILTCMDETKLKSYTIMALMLTCRTSGPIVAKDYAK